MLKCRCERESRGKTRALYGCKHQALAFAKIVDARLCHGWGSYRRIVITAQLGLHLDVLLRGLTAAGHDSRGHHTRKGLCR